MWLLVRLTEASLFGSGDRVAEFEIVAAYGTINRPRDVGVALHVQEREWLVVKRALVPTVVNRARANAIRLVFLERASLHCRSWLVLRIRLAEALLVVSVVGVAIERVHVAEQIAVGDDGGPAVGRHLGEGKRLLGLLVLFSSVVNGSVAAAEVHADVIGAVLGCWKGIGRLLSYAIALMTSGGVGHIEIGCLAGQKSVPVGTSGVLDADVADMHGRETTRLLAKVHLTEAIALLTFFGTFFGLKTFGQGVGTVGSVVSNGDCRRAIRRHRFRSSDFYCFRARVLENRSSRWTHPELLKWTESSVKRPINVKLKPLIILNCLVDERLIRQL